ncbi:type II toxin-antitoxin system prevent-host-death family antitoxin [Calidifontibacter sp. DB0510]|uniref:Antitoxin n=1 Tax=Metallococcus carri TaxID=1656884 RepID=A0A967EA95_9MICO|nr:type II toxin-antitoxin system prevent-host-death family antitoxin [Metallococcus carri]NHN55654.1 type II toxin-antitoxin system prevent-host-death family antitoxin [Metallococcus carri]NOP38162.1 type II toxin-antitoxin system prevent-host-death family antitoxin [Calidifontibacter sp. DB2511S]
MEAHSVRSAKAHLSRLLHDVEAGREVTILRGKRPVARIVPIAEAQRRRFGQMKFSVPDDFDAPIPDEELARWQ